MISPWRIEIDEESRPVFAASVAGTVELGRQDRGEPAPYARLDQAGAARIIIAGYQESVLSRRQVRLEPVSEDALRLTNLSTRLSIPLLGGEELGPGQTRELLGPVAFLLGRRTIRLRSGSQSEASILHSLPEATMPPSLGTPPPAPLRPLDLTGQTTASSEALVRWLQSALTVIQSAASSSDFFVRAVRTMVETMGLETGRALLRRQGQWRVEAERTGPGVVAQPDWQPSRRILDRVLGEKRTFWQAPPRAEVEDRSLTGIAAVVAAPILDPAGEVIGVLYGERRGDAPAAHHHLQTITKLEAMLVELLASGVAAGLTRLEQEWAALAARSRFEQFFSPGLAHLVDVQPELLHGQDREVTVLFGDIRGFSRITEQLGPARTVEWVSDVIEALSQCVLDQGGVLIDYIGDELLAMWGAPTPHPDHPQRACRAALAMRAALPRLNQRWEARIGSAIALGIGINTGIAHVGNTGNRLKLKYGPLGNTVNLASRVQGATKYLGADLLVTGPTRARLGDEFATRRLGIVRVVHIAEPVELHQLADAPTPGWQELARQYEAALAAFERNEPCETARLLGSLLVQHPDDRPSLILIERAVERIVGKAPDNDTVWILPNK